MEQVPTKNDEGICQTCGDPLGISKSNANRGQYKRCPRCYSKQYLKDWYQRNRDSVIAKSKEYYQQTAERRKLIARQNYHAMSAAEKKRVNRSAALKQKYGITVDDYERMFVEQGGRCFLCGDPPAEGRPLSVDHCHKEKRVRKLLCDVCNRSLGVIERDSTWVDRALEYLKS